MYSSYYNYNIMQLLYRLQINDTHDTQQCPVSANHSLAVGEEISGQVSANVAAANVSSLVNI